MHAPSQPVLPGQHFAALPYRVRDFHREASEQLSSHCRASCLTVPIFPCSFSAAAAPDSQHLEKSLQQHLTAAKAGLRLQDVLAELCRAKQAQREAATAAAADLLAGCSKQWRRRLKAELEPRGQLLETVWQQVSSLQATGLLRAPAGPSSARLLEEPVLLEHALLVCFLQTPSPSFQNIRTNCCSSET